MTNREQLIQELEKSSEETIEIVLEFVYRLKAPHPAHPLAKFAGMIDDEEAEELKRIIAAERKVTVGE